MTERSLLTDLAVPDGYKLYKGHFGDDSGVLQGTSACCYWDTNMVWDKHPLRDKSDEELAEAEALEKKRK